MDVDLSELERWVRATPGDTEAWARLSRAYAHAGRRGEAYVTAWRAGLPSMS